MTSSLLPSHTGVCAVCPGVVEMTKIPLLLLGLAPQNFEYAASQRPFYRLERQTDSGLALKSVIIAPPTDVVILKHSQNESLIA